MEIVRNSDERDSLVTNDSEERDSLVTENLEEKDSQDSQEFTKELNRMICRLKVKVLVIVYFIYL